MWRRSPVPDQQGVGCRWARLTHLGVLDHVLSLGTIPVERDKVVFTLSATSSDPVLHGSFSISPRVHWMKLTVIHFLLPLATPGDPMMYDPPKFLTQLMCSVAAREGLMSDPPTEAFMSAGLDCQPQPHETDGQTPDSRSLNERTYLVPAAQPAEAALIPATSACLWTIGTNSRLAILGRGVAFQP